MLIMQGQPLNSIKLQPTDLSQPEVMNHSGVAILPVVTQLLLITDLREVAVEELVRLVAPEAAIKSFL